MDLLSPQLLWVGDLCYRINPIYHEEQHYTRLQQQNTLQYIEKDLYEEGVDEDDFQIIPIENDRYKICYHIPQVFFAQIIGSKGATKKRIEVETKTQIKIPKPSVEDDVVIVGPTRQNVVSARRKVDLIVLAARNRHPFTHFFCVPITNEEIRENFRKFKNDVLSNSTSMSSDVDSSLFQSPHKLHLTIATLTLMDNNDRINAAEILQECKETVIEPIMAQYGQINLIVKGLEIMNDDPSAVDVLYGKIDSEPMQLIANGIVDRLIQRGLMQRKTEKVKLHVTLINSLFREEYDPGNPLLKSRQTFDARKILEKFKTFEFGTQLLEEIHLSQRYSTANDGFYEATGIIII